MADEELEVIFTLENNPLNAEYELNPNDEIDADFLINAQGTTWGSISGDINNQSDLIELLELKADKSEVESITGALADSITAEVTARENADTILNDSITAVSNNLQIEATTRADNDIILQNNINALSNSLTAEIGNRASADTILHDNINALDDKVDSLTGALNDRIDTLSDTVTANYNALDDKIDSVNGTLSDSITAIESTINNYGDIVTYNAADFATSLQGALADTSLQPNDNISEMNNDVGYITSAALPIVNNSTITIQKNSTTVESFTLNQATNKIVNISVPTTAADVKALPDTTTINDLTTTLQQNALNSGITTTLTQQISTNQSNINDLTTTVTNNYNTLDARITNETNTLNNAINAESTNRQNADNALQTQIDAITSASDVFDIVGTYAELQDYDISSVPVNNIIKVLVDSTHGGAATYYRCVEVGGVKSWSYIGSEGAYYTKSEADTIFVAQTRTINGKPLNNNITLTAADVNALSENTVIGNGTITLQKNGTSIDNFSLNSTTDKVINITVPTDTNDLTNGAEFITNSALTPYALIANIPTKTSDLTNNSGFITNSALTPYALTSSLATVATTGLYSDLINPLSLLGTGDITIEEIQQVEGVTNAANTKVLTEFSDDVDDMEYEIRVKALTGSFYIFQSRTNSTASPYGISGSSSSNTIAGYGASSVVSGITRTNQHIYHIKYTHKDGVATLYVKDETDNVEATDSTTYDNYAPTVGKIGLFGQEKNYIGAGTTIYFAKLRKNGELVMDYVPAVKNGVVGFFDYCTNTFIPPTNGTLTAVGTPTKTICNISFNNNSGFITGISSNDVETALGYTPASTENVSDLFNNRAALDLSNITSMGTIISNEFNTVNTALDSKANTTLSNVLTIDSNSAVQTALNGKTDTDLSNLSTTGKLALYGNYVSSHLDIASSASYPTTTNTQIDLSSYLPNDGNNYFVLFRFECTTGTTSGNQAGMFVSSDLETYSINLGRTRTRTTSSVNCAGSGYIPIGTGRVLNIVANSNFTGTYTAALLGYIRMGTNL